jgi:hypothetical protein
MSDPGERTAPEWFHEVCGRTAEEALGACGVARDSGDAEIVRAAERQVGKAAKEGVLLDAEEVADWLDDPRIRQG